MRAETRGATAALVRPVGSSALLLCAILAAPRAAGEEQVVGGGAKVSVQIVTWLTEDSGPTAEAGRAGASLAAGESGAVYTAVGSFDASGRPADDFCTAKTGGCRGESARHDSPQVFAAACRVLPAPIGEIRPEVDWRHDASTRRGGPVLVRWRAERSRWRRGSTGSGTSSRPAMTRTTPATSSSGSGPRSSRIHPPPPGASDTIRGSSTRTWPVGRRRGASRAPGGRERRSSSTSLRVAASSRAPDSATDRRWTRSRKWPAR